MFTVEPVAASHAIAAALRGPSRTVHVLAAFPTAVYLAHPGGVVALVTSDGVRLPNALVLTRPTSHRPLAGLHTAQRGEVGDGGVRIGGRRLAVVRWFDPVPRLAITSRVRLARHVVAAHERLAAVSGSVPASLTGPLTAVTDALRAGNAARVAYAARSLIGLGPGLTPAGDDVLAGLFAGTLALLPAVTGPATTTTEACVRDAGQAVADRACDATTAISAALLRHAARGEVAAPAATVLHALTGRGSTCAALDGLLAVGATSGRDLTVGLLAAAELVSAGTSASPATPRTPSHDRTP